MLERSGYKSTTAGSGAEALEQGAGGLEEALRSPHYRDYLRATGRLALQFGYSDSGRYVGPLAATYLIERLRLKAAEALIRHNLTNVVLVLFDTHGESVGRGAHPGSLADRLAYLSPPATRKTLAAAGISVREESAFQGGDGYLLFGTPELALATVARIAEHAFPPEQKLPPDPIYDDADFSADFFATCRVGMQELVEDQGYAALLGAFGPALLDPTGSRPSWPNTALRSCSSIPGGWPSASRARCIRRALDRARWKTGARSRRSRTPARSTGDRGAPTRAPPGAAGPVRASPRRASPGAP